jgi:DNA repair protein RadC
MLCHEKLSIRQWAANDRPREKMTLSGSRSLSDAELLAILIGSGNRNETAVELARKVLSTAGNNLNELARMSQDQLQAIRGIGPSRALSIMAALELGRRKNDSEPDRKPAVNSSGDAYSILKGIMGDLSHEEAWVLLLNNAGRLLSHRKTSQGGLTGTIMDPRLIIREALLAGSTRIVIAHNHPSGNLSPSDADMAITKKIKESASLVDITLLDHIIVTQDKYYSFADEGLI